MTALEAAQHIESIEKKIAALDAQRAQLLKRLAYMKLLTAVFFSVSNLTEELQVMQSNRNAALTALKTVNYPLNPGHTILRKYLFSVALGIQRTIVRSIKHR